MKFYKYLFISFFCLFFSCKTNNPEVATVTTSSPSSDPVRISAFQEHYPAFQYEMLEKTLSLAFNKEPMINSFYREAGYKSVWTKDTFNTAGIDTLLAYLWRTPEHGLEPERFQTKAIQATLDSVKAGLFSERMPELYNSLVRMEFLATKAAIDYVTGMRFGFLNPKDLYSKSYAIEIKKPDTAYFHKLNEGLKNDPVMLILSSQPTGITYKAMQEELLFIKTRLDSSFVQIPAKKGTANYKLNEKGQVFPLIARRLMLTGELPFTDKPDSVYSHLNSELLEAINKFRIKNSYPEETEIGKITVDALNRPLSYYYKKLQANLERYRWQRVTELPAKYIEVNVAAFNLKAIEPNHKPLLMNVCVGSVKNQTPLLESKITYMNLNPQWNVPRSITEKEIYWSMKKDSTYLQRHNMKLLKNGAAVDPGTIDWNKVTPKNFPYYIRQESGNGNSLGRIKFMFENSFSVYLHDTPVKRAFSAKNRAVSHGCVRLQKPVDMIHFCLLEKDSLFYDRMRYSIDQPPLTEEGKKLLKAGKLQKVQDIVNLQQPIPLFIDYFTSYTLPDDKILYFADDVYGFDEKIIKGLNL